MMSRRLDMEEQAMQLTCCAIFDAKCDATFDAIMCYAIGANASRPFLAPKVGSSLKIPVALCCVFKISCISI